MRILSEYSSLIFAWFSNFPVCFHFPAMVAIFSLSRRKEHVQTNLLNTLNMIMKSIENFLEALQKKFYLQKYYHPSQL